MTTKQQDTEFKKCIGEQLPNKLLQVAIDWLRDNMNPDEIYDQQRLNQFVGNAALPDEVFSEPDLIKWAEENGYTKPPAPKRISYCEL